MLERLLTLLHFVIKAVEGKMNLEFSRYILYNHV